MATSDEYAAGECNIGDAEIARRRRAGYAGLVGFAVLLSLLVIVDAAAGWYLTLFAPAFVAASGFVQAANRFCYAFGFSSMFNFGDLGQQRRVRDAASRRLDRAKAVGVIGTTLLISGGVTLIALGVALGYG